MKRWIFLMVMGFWVLPVFSLPALAHEKPSVEGLIRVSVGSFWFMGGKVYLIPPGAITVIPPVYVLPRSPFISPDRHWSPGAKHRHPHHKGKKHHRRFKPADTHRHR